MAAAPEIDDADSLLLSPSERGTLETLLPADGNALTDSLSARELKVLHMRFGIGMNTDYTLQEIAESLNLTRERVRQIEMAALAKLRGVMEGKGLGADDF